MARLTASPQDVHWTEIKRVVRYLNRTTEKRIWYTHVSDLRLHGYSDLNFARHYIDRKSTTGYVFLLLRVKYLLALKNTIVALSTIEAGYISIATAARGYLAEAIGQNNGSGRERWL